VAKDGEEDAVAYEDELEMLDDDGAWEIVKVYQRRRKQARRSQAGNLCDGEGPPALPPMPPNPPYPPYPPMPPVFFVNACPHAQHGSTLPTGSAMPAMPSDAPAAQMGSSVSQERIGTAAPSAASTNPAVHQPSITAQHFLDLTDHIASPPELPDLK
jgi:hypothetical protein